jgi:hypothetical protein
MGSVEEKREKAKILLGSGFQFHRMVGSQFEWIWSWK